MPGKFFYLRFTLSVMIGVLLAGGSLSQIPPQENSPIFLIEVPASQISPTAQSVLNLASADAKEIRIHVLRPEADSIDYGQVYPQINGAAAARVSETRAGERGKVVRILLKSRPGFELLPGPNTVEVLATNTKGREFRASFTLHIPAGACSGSRRAKILGIQELTDLLHAGVSNNRLVQLVSDCGVNFPPSPQNEEKLRAAGAEEKLIEAIRNPGGSKAAGVRGKGLGIDEIADLLGAGVTNDRLVDEVHKRGVNFQLDSEAEKKLRKAGAQDELIKAIRAAGESPPAP